MKAIRRFFRIGVFFLKLIAAYIIAFIGKIFSSQLRKVWIISERGDDARDNGFFFYRFIREKHSEKNIWYVITQSSADYPKVSRIGNTVEYRSFFHFVLYAASELRISSNMWGGDLPEPSYFKKLHSWLGRRKKFLYLKHGVDKDYDPTQYSKVFHPTLATCGAYPEYEYDRDHFGHTLEVYQYLGFSRFDNLRREHAENRQILVMPTFRKWLQGSDFKDVSSSEYVAKWNEFIQDPRLIEALESKDLMLVFYPHYVMQKYLDAFTTVSNRIKIASFAEYDVQQLLMESKLLITDFSSVFFDFAYMEKPVLYYQFDRERYISEHYDFTKGYFSYDRDGFGDVLFDKDSLIEKSIELINSGFQMQEKYHKKIDTFFPVIDNHNCERIYDQIQILMKEK